MDIAPIVVAIPHSLGKAEASRRIKARIDDSRTRDAARFKVAEENWDGDRLSFRIALLGLPVTGTIDIGDDQARAERPGVGEIRDVTAVQDVEHAVREHDGRSQRRAQGNEGVAGDQLAFEGSGHDGGRVE